jgi:hypothetical protein
LLQSYVFENYLLPAAFFPLQLALLSSASDNLLPMAHWAVISKEPFWFLIAIGVGNFRLGLIKKHGKL